jgi:subtilisin-like proprotein convertase family protein
MIRITKKLLMEKILIAGMLLAGSWAQAGIYTQSFSGGTVTGGNPTGTPFSGNFTMAAPGDLVTGITLTLNVSGGYSGGFYFSLTAPDGNSTVILMNQPNTDNMGMNLSFADGGTTMTSGSNLSSGTYAPLGTLPSLDGQSANGNWTLYFADTSSGETPTLTGWSLIVDPVPEPVNMALAAFGICVVGGNVASHFLRRKNSLPAA